MSNFKVIPIFRIFDYNKAVKFYVQFLGFEIVWEYRDGNSPVYMEIAKDDLVLHLTEHHGDCTPGSKVFITVKDGLRSYHTELINKKYRYNRPGLEVAPWNALTMEVVDPFSNKLLFSQPLPATNTV